ncbi:MAG: hypothetical protein QM472_11375 [Spirochaetota bacterium]|nr:hypothetical protein [Spirochaetota bacterium]HPI15566.1 hypothetical protein [Spirochaetota bacterium]
MKNLIITVSIIFSVVLTQSAVLQAREGVSLGVGVSYFSDDYFTINSAGSEKNDPDYTDVSGTDLLMMGINISMRYDAKGPLFARIDFEMNRSIINYKEEYTELFSGSHNVYEIDINNILIPLSIGVNLQPSGDNGLMNVYLGLGCTYYRFWMDIIERETAPMLNAKYEVHGDIIMPHILVGMDLRIAEGLYIFLEAQKYISPVILTDGRADKNGSANSRSGPSEPDASIRLGINYNL